MPIRTGIPRISDKKVIFPAPYIFLLVLQIWGITGDTNYYNHKYVKSIIGIQTHSPGQI